MGRGEYQAAFANFRALTVIGAPLFYGRLYAHFAPRGLAGVPYFGGAAVVGIAELLHLSLRSNHLFMGNGPARAEYLKEMEKKKEAGAA